MTQHTNFDVIIIGGGAAGMAAAVTLSRSLRPVLVIDAGHPRNSPAAGAHNLLGQEGVNPLELLRRGRAEAEGYGARILEDAVTGLARTSGGFSVVSAAHGEFIGRRVVLATGLRDELPDVPGLAVGWGHSVLHCPYCHGWEARDGRIGVIATSAMSVHQALLFSNLSGQVTYIAHTPEARPAEEQARLLQAVGVTMVDGPVVSVTAGEVPGAVTGLLRADGTEMEFDHLVVAPRFVVDTTLFEQVGGEPADHPMGQIIPVDDFGRTPVDGVWAAGNAADLAAMVVSSAAAGVIAAAHINAELTMEDAAARAAGSSTGPTSPRQMAG